jgi:hypothetical protein
MKPFTLCTAVGAFLLALPFAGTLPAASFDDEAGFQGHDTSVDAHGPVDLRHKNTRDATAEAFDNFSAAAAEIMPLPQFSVKWFTVDGGGGLSTGSRFTIQGTIGQPDAGQPILGGGYSVRGGFWGASTVRTPGAPHLVIAPGGPGMATVSWTPDEPGWILQQSSSPTSSTWSDAPSGSMNPVTVSSALPGMFYRLHKP